MPREAAPPAPPAPSKLFAPFRAVGDVCGPACPLVLRRLGNAKTFASVAVARSFVVYDCEHLRVALLSRPLPAAITALCAGGSHTTFAAAGHVIYKFERNVAVLEYTGHEASILCLINFGIDVLVSLDKAGTLMAWDAKSGDCTAQCELGSDFKPTTMIHPSTYLNKVLVGGAGGLQLWNFHSGKQLYVFQRLAKVECLAQSPAMDVVAVGLRDGRIVLLNIRFDTELFSLSQSGGDAVSALAFGSDQGRTLLASGSTSGQINLWSLEDRRLHLSRQDAHHGRVVSLAFMPAESGFISSGQDNAIKLWSLEGGRLEITKSREGHAKPPTLVRFHPGGEVLASLASGADARSLQMLTSGSDGSLRVFHALLDHRTREFSHRAARIQDSASESRLPPVVAFASSEAREKDWCNVVTAHQGQAAARAWSFEKGALGVNGGALSVRSKGFAKMGGGSKRKRGANDRDAAAEVTSVCLSACGSYAVVGLESGLCAKYNIQSGIPRGCFPLQVWPKAAKKKRTLVPAGSVYATTKEPTPQERAASCVDADVRHTGAVVGLSLDLLGVRLYSAGVDGTLKAWDFASHALERTLELGGAPVSQMASSRDGALLVLASDDLALRVVDSASLTLVRLFMHAHRATISDLCFSPDARWVVSASLDGSVKVWDVPSAKCIDWLAFDDPATSVSVCPTSDYMATTHAGHTAVFLWANRLRFEPDVAPSSCTAPMRMLLDGELDKDWTETDYENDAEALLASDNEQSPLEPADGRALVTLTSAPDKWFSLAFLDVVRQRNQPVMPPEKPESAPFFLPVSASDIDAGRLEARSKDVGEGGGEADDKNTSAARRLSGKMRSRMHTLLESGDWAGAVTLLELSSASAIDFELLTSSHGDDDAAGVRLLGCWLTWAAHELKSGQRFELVQAVLSRLLQMHGDICASHPELRPLLENVQSEHKRAWASLNEDLQRAQCLVEFDLRVV